MVLDAVLVAMTARLDEARGRCRRVGVDEVDLARLVVVGIDEDELRRLRRRERDVVADVLLLVDEDIGFDRRADRMPVDLQRAVVVVEAHIEQRPAVVGPHEGSARVGDAVGEVQTGREVADADGVELGSTVVARVGKQRMIGAVLRVPEVPIGLALGLGVAVEEHGLGAARARAAAEQRILPAGDEARGVGEGPVGRRHGAVVLLEAPLHLQEQLVLEPPGVGELGIAEGVLGLEIGADLRVERGRIAHHVLPVAGLEPGIVVDKLGAVPGRGAGMARAGRGLGEGVSVCRPVHVLTLHATR